VSLAAFALADRLAAAFPGGSELSDGGRFLELGDGAQHLTDENERSAPRLFEGESFSEYCEVVLGDW
jgi:hypothetical protein